MPSRRGRSGISGTTSVCISATTIPQNASTATTMPDLFAGASGPVAEGDAVTCGPSDARLTIKNTHDDTDAVRSSHLRVHPHIHPHHPPSHRTTPLTPHPGTPLSHRITPLPRPRERHPSAASPGAGRGSGGGIGVSPWALAPVGGRTF
ncbi:hypothetical protein Skr01_00560 [Sphaerisporangium krabiense]|nr:hypothetical protein Skr01_00560 [Sphaerisporangium krabiense]